MGKILITGGAGFIGTALAATLSENKDNKIVIFDNFSTGSVDNIPPAENICIVRGDTNKKSEVKDLMLSHCFDYVFHYAAMVGVKRTLENPLGVLKDIDGIKNVLNYSKETNVERFFFSSSSEVYGEPVELPQNEDTTPLNSRLPYAIVKNVGESYCKAFFNEYGLQYTIFRFFNTYGKNQSTDFVIPKFIQLALRNKDISVYGDGEQTRTFFNIRDNTDFTKKVLEEDMLANQTVNVGCHCQISIISLAKMIIDLTGSRSIIRHLAPLKEGDMSARMPDNSKMLSILNRPLIPLDKGLEEIIKFKINKVSHAC